MILPLALAQFIASYAGHEHERGHQRDRPGDLGTTVAGSADGDHAGYTLTMAASDDPGQQADQHLGPASGASSSA